VGLNRWEQQPWKGYLDELMIFGDTLTAEEVMTVYENTQPAKVENVTAVNWDSTIVVAWDAVDGINEYNVYYSTGGTVDANSPYITVTGGTVVNFDNLTAGQNYTYAVAGVSPLGVGELSDPTTVTVDYASVDAEIAARFTATGAEELLYLVTHTYNANGYSNLLPVFPDDLMRMVGTDNVTHTFATLANNTTVAMAPNPTAGNDSRYRYNDFRFTIHSFDQAEQNLYADYASKPECKDKDFRTLVSWMGCVGVEFVDRHTSFLSSRLPDYDRRSILPYTTLGADGVWQLQFKHHWWGYANYTIIR
jgi:hypothetical protein